MKLIIFALTSAAAVIRTSSFTLVSNSVETRSSLIRKAEFVLNLVPSQGCQLAAASAAALAKKQQDNNKEEPVEKIIIGDGVGPSDATREFVSRIFNLPSQIVNGGTRTHSHRGSKEVVDFKIPGIQESYKNNHDDIVLFPIVGFQYVKLQDGSIRSVPTMNASPEKAACNFDAMNMSKQQPLHGWFSPSCILGDIFANDNEYCGENCSST